MLNQVSGSLLAGSPTLIHLEQDKWVWRVPIDLTFPSHGHVGKVGEVDVGAQHGEVHYTDALLEQIRQAARELARHVLHPAQ